ncbi:MAG: MFS transporter [Burkholderiales bacterium]|nr:MFS transporter [Burkholderiales bacterium]MDE2433361.1 MFS transporter [Burkholderiales bacterium]
MNTAAHTWSNGWRYGLLGLPLAFVSLPLYVQLPRYYAEHHAIALSTLGGVLLVTRLLDAVIDPRIGHWVDALFQRHATRPWRAAAWASMGLLIGFCALWHAPSSPASATRTLAWLSAALVLTYLSYSVASMVHQTWGARWGGRADERARLVAWREGLALIGVVMASVLPSLAGMDVTAVVLGIALLVGCFGLRATGAAQPAPPLHPTTRRPSQVDSPRPAPWTHPPFAALMIVFLLNGSASAIPATLLPFFVRDTLQAGTWEPMFLLAYFAAAAVGLPLWTVIVRHMGLAQAWLAGMVLSVLAFCSVPLLGAGDVAPFAAICVASGLALGADLAIPSALLTGLIHQAGWGRQSEGQFFGWWTAATKLNLALASGMALPLLSWFGYETGVSNARNQSSLALTYGVLPCLLKGLAMAALIWASRRHAVLKGES